ncbi:hypothetical protein B9Z19DRAFT_1119571 [Tuber borchii]|uniref:Uncharacterized protein n=1 Tax=Tuber borchii TaxID=42251 RepID=A0A2T7A6H8_TUBBO|nr:hypothetical protein B9Z19DRAFT_1119571 [Tuber borchii]
MIESSVYTFLLDRRLHYVIQQSSVYARKELKEAANRIFGPLGVKSNGDSEIADLMAAGSLLPVSDGSLEMWTSADAEKFITKTVVNRAINAAIKSQKVYISCTQGLLYFKDKDSKGIEVKECKLDSSGPQNMKACIGEVACYLYR